MTLSIQKKRPKALFEFSYFDQVGCKQPALREYQKQRVLIEEDLAAHGTSQRMAALAGYE